jgi:hypothetical protein
MVSNIDPQSKERSGAAEPSLGVSDGPSDEASAVMSSRVVVDGELACKVEALAIATAERSPTFQDERRKILQALLRRAEEDLARVQIVLPRLGLDHNGHGDLVRRTRAALDELAFGLGRSTGR